MENNLTAGSTIFTWDGQIAKIVEVGSEDNYCLNASYVRVDRSLCVDQYNSHNTDKICVNQIQLVIQVN